MARSAAKAWFVFVKCSRSGSSSADTSDGLMVKSLLTNRLLITHRVTEISLLVMFEKYFNFRTLREYLSS